MTKGTIAVLLIKEKVLSGNGDFHSFLSSLDPTEWQTLKFCVLPLNQKIIQHEIKSVHKLCDVVVIIVEENANSSLNIFEVISNIFCENPGTSSSLLNGDEKHGLIPTAAKFLTLPTPKEHLSPVISLQQIFILKGTHCRTTATFQSVLKPYLADFKKDTTFKKTFELINTESSASKFRMVVNNGVSVSVLEENSKIVVSVMSPSFETIVNFENKVIDEVRNDVINSYVDDAAVFDSFYYQVDPKISEATKVIEECFSRYDHENVFVSFNGGKDCTVLLHLTLMVLRKNYPDHKNPLLCWYVRSADAFPEQDLFISQCKQYYNLEVMTVQSDIKEALSLVLKRRPNMKACLMGTRRTDPYSSNLEIFQLTDPDWPQVVRVFPLLDWHYSYIWDYLLYFNVPYCSLYDMGYTSVGNVKNTVRNPSLLAYDILQEKEVYLPAYKLLDGTKERNGRH